MTTTNMTDMTPRELQAEITVCVERLTRYHECYGQLGGRVAKSDRRFYRRQIQENQDRANDLLALLRIRADQNND